MAHGESLQVCVIGCHRPYTVNQNVQVNCNQLVWYLIAMANQAESVLFYIPNATLGFHFETELELIQNHLDQVRFILLKAVCSQHFPQNQRR